MDNPQPPSQDRDNDYLIDLTLDDKDQDASGSNGKSSALTLPMLHLQKLTSSDRQGQAHGPYLHWQAAWCSTSIR